MINFYTSVSQYGNSIQVRGYESGKRFKKSVKFSPILFIPSNTKTDYKTIHGEYVYPQEFEKISDAKEFIKKYEGVEGFQYYGTTNFIHQYIAYTYPNKIEYDFSKIRIQYFDIEVTPENTDSGFPHPEQSDHPITCIALYDSVDKMYRVWSSVNWEHSKSLHKDSKIDFFWFETESDLMRSFIRFIGDEFTSPDILVGYNSGQFDIPYIVNRTQKILGEEWVKKLSPWSRVYERMVSIMKKQVQYYDIVGLNQLDFMELIKKFGHSLGPQETYKLDHIANVVLGERKVSYDEEYGNLINLKNRNPQLFVDYCINDSQLLVRMEEKLGLVGLACNLVYKAGATFPEVFGTTSIWDALIHRFLMSRNIVVPMKRDSFKREFEGAYVKDPLVGSHDWLASFDVASLYPNIIVQWNMSPETILFGEVQDGVSIDNLLNEKVKCNREDVSMAASGQYFDKSKKGFLPEIIEELYSERQIVKKKMLTSKQKLEYINAELKKRGLL